MVDQASLPCITPSPAITGGMAPRPASAASAAATTRAGARRLRQRKSPGAQTR